MKNSRAASIARPEQDSVLAREPNGFIASPFQDEVFAVIARTHGYKDIGQEWPRTIVGLRSEDLEDVPPEMPAFNFTPGTCEYDGYMEVELADNILYLHTSLAIPHLILTRGAMPQTIWLGLLQMKTWNSLEGRDICKVISHPALQGFKVGKARIRDLGVGSHCIDVALTAPAAAA